MIVDLPKYNGCDNDGAVMEHCICPSEYPSAIVLGIKTPKHNMASNMRIMSPRGIMKYIVYDSEEHDEQQEDYEGRMDGCWNHCKRHSKSCHGKTD